MSSEENVEVRSFYFEDDGSIPNNPNYPLLLYKNCISDYEDPKSLLAKNNWLGSWKGRVDTRHHYHSTSHEVLIVSSGTALLQLGGEYGKKADVKKGDLIVIPAGVGHKRLEASDDFTVVGAYPGGQSYDFGYGEADERPEKVNNIKKVSIPATDPLFGNEGPLFSFWGNKDE